MRGVEVAVPDGLPVIGRPPEIENVTLAAGHGMWGLQLAPVTALLVAQLIAGRTPSHDLEPPSRGAVRTARAAPPAADDHGHGGSGMSVLVWSMVGIALWHFTVLLPDKFAGGIIGAFLAALVGALVSGYALPAPGLPTENPPGLSEAIWALPGSAIALAGSYVWGSRQDTHE